MPRVGLQSKAIGPQVEEGSLPGCRGFSGPFAINGLVSTRRLQDGRWREAYRRIEPFSNEFKSLFQRWAKGYPWPSDPLRCWFRPFEYPYVLQNLPPVEENTRPVVADIGSAVTFFSVFLSQFGYRVRCVDSDRRMMDFWQRAKACFPRQWADPASRIEYNISTDVALPFRPSEVDAVTCISVLEHVSDPPKLMAEMLRILKPGGVLIITMDVSLESNRGVSAEHFSEICGLLEGECIAAHSDETVHPQELLVQPDIPHDLVSISGKPEMALRERLTALSVRFRRFLRHGPSPRSLCLFVGTYTKRQET